MTTLETTVWQSRYEKGETTMYLAVADRKGQNIEFKLPFYLDVRQWDGVVFRGPTVNIEGSRITHRGYEEVSFVREEDKRTLMRISASALDLLTCFRSFNLPETA